MAQATAPILDSTLAAELKCSHPRRVLEGKRTISGHWEYGRTCAFDACLESILLGVPPQKHLPKGDISRLRATGVTEYLAGIPRVTPP
jgi:hypothetical protein